MPKRARSNGTSANGKRRRVYAARRFIPGSSRTAGYYGRFEHTNGELKFFDLDLDDAVVAAAGAVTDSINKIAQGVTEVTRVGRKAFIKRIRWSFNYTLPEQDAVADPASGDVLRVIVYKDKQANGATAAVTDILESADYQSFLNLANSMRFVILTDKTYSINYATMNSDGAGVTSQSSVIRSGTWFKTCNIPLEFNASTGAITEIRSNNIGVLLISKNGICGFQSKLRLRFKD